MSIKSISIIAFVVMAFVQIAVPFSMIWHRESVLSTGHTYKFRCRPIDPNDPFRGKYVTLRFEAELVELEVEKQFSRGEQVYGILGEDLRGFAYIRDIQKELPSDGSDYVSLTIRSSAKSKSIRVRLPFNRYYMNEHKAPEAERIFFTELINPDTETVALVSIKNGTPVLKAVLIDGVALEDVVELQ